MNDFWDPFRVLDVESSPIRDERISCFQAGTSSFSSHTLLEFTAPEVGIYSGFLDSSECVIFQVQLKDCPGGC